MGTTTTINWKLGRQRIDQLQKQIENLGRITSLIRTAESEYNELIKYSQSEICSGPGELATQLRYGAIRDIQIRKHQALRLQRMFTINANELSL